MVEQIIAENRSHFKFSTSRGTPASAPSSDSGGSKWTTLGGQHSQNLTKNISRPGQAAHRFPQPMPGSSVLPATTAKVISNEADQVPKGCQVQQFCYVAGPGASWPPFGDLVSWYNRTPNNTPGHLPRTPAEIVQTSVLAASQASQAKSVAIQNLNATSASKSPPPTPPFQRSRTSSTCTSCATPGMPSRLYLATLPPFPGLWLLNSLLIAFVAYFTRRHLVLFSS
ncbi:hypothetical protein B0J13DRAFT_654385 [Dactylonectria estremocensis]|uniref:Uncharacterized protein n=1 Tax=Dactylonectria estremocensis TaxID=1079267 RepID=A0A9P9J8T3_9HYPO|nr:hypothetical protein B0J13DRAFT_654385 [Dactylonectria estremocensis]